ncbi:MAG TPA: hypothetical protein VLZ83_11690 [Edaphocola sp.]|nr:hypothetical protein [Edaphocola sp.]
MKKKVIFAVATGLFALAMVFNMNVLQSNNTGDVSLESIAVMAQANGESGGGHANICDPIWKVTYTGSVGTGNVGAQVTCETGGSYICPICFWK